MAASGTSRRSVYAGVFEHSVYVDRAARGMGAGHLLFSRSHEATSGHPAARAPLNGALGGAEHARSPGQGMTEAPQGEG